MKWIETPVSIEATENPMYVAGGKCTNYVPVDYPCPSYCDKAVIITC